VSLAIDLTKAELIKLRRSYVFGLTIIFPCTILIGLLMLGIYNDEFNYQSWLKVTLTSWAYLILPFFTALATFLLAGLEHRNSQWKHIDALPTPRWKIYLAKQSIHNLTMLFAHVVLLLGILICGGIIYAFHSKTFGAPPLKLIFGGVAICYLSSLFMQSFHHWIAIRYSSVAISLGSALLGLFSLAFMGDGETIIIGRYYPWAYAGQAITEWFPGFHNHPHPWMIVGLSLVGWALFAAIGCREVSRREII